MLADVRLLQRALTLLSKIRTYQAYKDQSTFLPGESEDLSSIAELITLVEGELQRQSNGSVLDGTFADQARAFLKSRWQRIANGPFCYTKKVNYPYNDACVLLASSLDIRKTNSLLMPDVSEQDIYGNELNTLNFLEFIISDDRKRFITIDSLIDTACERIKALENFLYLTVDENGSQLRLSESELQRLGEIKEIVDSVQAWFLNRRSRRSNLLNELIDLRDGLLRGDVNHGGEEMNAGVPANVSIANFYAVFSTLDEEVKESLVRLTDGESLHNMGEILNNLFRPIDANYQSVTYCIAIQGQHLQRVIEANVEYLSGLNVNQSRNLQGMINLIKSKFCGDGLRVSGTNGQTSFISQLDANLSFDEATWVVSFVSPDSKKSISSLFFHSRIVVEGIKDGKLYCGTYWPTIKTAKTWSFLPGALQNTQGVFGKINVHESNGYVKIPYFDQDRGLRGDSDGNFHFRFDQANQLGSSYHRSYRVEVELAERMIASIKADAERTNFANWVVNLNDSNQEVQRRRVNDVQANQEVAALFIPAERYGSMSFFGTGKDNEVTWCEKQLAVAECGGYHKKDQVGASPAYHVTMKGW